MSILGNSSYVFFFSFLFFFFKLQKVGKTGETIQLMKPILQLSWPHICERSRVSFQLVINLVFPTRGCRKPSRKITREKSKENTDSVVIFMTRVVPCLETMLIRSAVRLLRDSAVVLLLFFSDGMVKRGVQPPLQRFLRLPTVVSGCSSSTPSCIRAPATDRCHTYQTNTGVKLIAHHFCI